MNKRLYSPFNGKGICAGELEIQTEALHSALCVHQHITDEGMSLGLRPDLNI